VCRGIDIIRQQFNKYLSGQVTPSRHNRRRIGDFFNIDEALLETPHSVFSLRSKTMPADESEGNGIHSFSEKMVAVIPGPTISFMDESVLGTAS
jgi:hypothetical protein